ncbi:MAG: hypothetical protein P1U40_00290 [Coxiellaceae bacterium]|nr:hypothetical protein [Coxiellaceae bacterium]
MKANARIRCVRIWILTICCLFSQLGVAAELVTPPPASGRNPIKIQHIIPADVLARVKLLDAELNNIRIALGKPKVQQQILTVSNVSPREVYFEAQALYEKSNKLAYEVTGSFDHYDVAPPKDITPMDVWKVVDAALVRVLSIKQRLHIRSQVKEKAEPDDITPTQVFNALLQSNHIVNSLLYHRVEPSNVYQEVTLAIKYAEKTLKNMGVNDRLPTEPKLEHGKTPTDVYKRLIECVRLLSKISQQSHMKMLSVKLNKDKIQQLTPSSVYDLSKIVVAETRFLSLKQQDSEMVRSFYPGYKTPSEVYQRVGILMQQLKLIEQYNIKKQKSTEIFEGDKSNAEGE